MLLRLSLFLIMGIFFGCVSPPKPFEPVIPKSPEQSSVAGRQASLSIVVDRAGRITVNDRILRKDDDLTELVRLVKEESEENRSSGDEKYTVYVKAKKDVKYDYVKRVTDELTKIDGVAVGIQWVE